MRILCAYALILLSTGCSELAMQQRIDVPGVGLFSLETIDGFDD